MKKKHPVCLSSDICIFQTYCILGTELNHWGIFGITITDLLNDLAGVPNNIFEASEGVGCYGEKSSCQLDVNCEDIA